MRKLINYFRQCFCKHEFEFLNKVRIFENEKDSMPVSYKLLHRCTKCGYVQITRY